MAVFIIPSFAERASEDEVARAVLCLLLLLWYLVVRYLFENGSSDTNNLVYIIRPFYNESYACAVWKGHFVVTLFMQTP